METGRVSYAQVYQWHQELQRALYAGTDDAKEDEQTVIGINLVPYSIEETATMLLVVEQRRWVYVALDVQLSPARQLALLQRSGARRLVTSVDSPLATFVVNRFAGEHVKTQVVGDKTSPFLPVQVVTLPSKYFQIEVEQTGRGAGGRRQDDIQVDAPLYVLYTSGTTGKEKRVLGSRKGAWTRLEWMWKIYPFTTLKTGRSSERVLRATRLSFVDSVWEILGAFLQRVPLVHLQPPRHRVKSTSFSYMTSVVLDNSPRFLKVVCNEGVTRFTAVPSVLDVLLLQTTENERKSCLNGLRYVLSSGESLPFHVVRRLTASLPNVTILNLYGSTELSGDVTCMEFDARSLPTQVAARERDDVPIATLDERGIVGGGETSLVLVSEDQKNDIRHSGNGSATLIWPRNHSSEIEGTTRTGKQPVSGVLYVSGPLLTDEYAGDIQGNMFPDLASISGRRTENDPARNENPSWWFRTGDICSVIHRYIYFDGRKDSAVKTRGHLIHMDAVERAVALALKETTEDAQIDSTGGIVAFPVPKKVSKHGLLITSIMAFVLYEDTGSTGIVQYSQTKKLNAWIAEHHGTAHIPHKVFMVPAKVVPRFANGKIDRKSLKRFFEYAIDQRDTLALCPRINSVMISPAQTLVANLLNEILGIPSSDDVYDDIRSRTFGELGGNSLLATLFVHELRQQFGALSLTARELLEMRIEEIVSGVQTVDFTESR
ncbi:unnamed protein product [Hyaloperonospora brassicae]|uniref:Carrier domain-containing protein n=1 Tax=Hyaloperonospora brassicae TaxID=162125 RepID=A0AAV0T6X4_HYABA|nr:unnamed protein product [Hyaloperonospora brassicae]